MQQIIDKVFTLNPKLRFYASFQKAKGKFQLSKESFMLPEVDVAVVIGAKFAKSFEPSRPTIIVEEEMHEALLFLQSEHSEVLNKENVDFLLVDHPSVFQRLAVFLSAKSVYFSPSFGVKSIEDFKSTMEAKMLNFRMGLSEMKDFGARTLSNILHNISSMHSVARIESYKNIAHNQPAVIIGAGPSLEDQVTALKKAYGKALFFSGGSAIASLVKHQVPLDYLIAVDPYEDHLKRAAYFSHYDVPCFFSPRCIPGVLPSIVGSKVYLPSVFGFPFLETLEAKFALQTSDFPEDRGWSLICSLVQIAKYMGCSPIYLVGVDLAYKGDKAFADDFFEEKTKGLETKDIWIEEGRWLSHFAKEHTVYRVGAVHPLPQILAKDLTDFTVRPSLKKPKNPMKTAIDYSQEVLELKQEFFDFAKSTFNEDFLLFHPYYRKIVEPLYETFYPFFTPLKETILNERSQETHRAFIQGVIETHEGVFSELATH